MKDYFKKSGGDRADGWRVRDIDTVYTVMPYVLRTRIDSQCLFEESIDAGRAEEFIKQHRDDIPNLAIMHIVIAAMVRTISQRPYVNRFIVHNKLYAHNDIEISLVIKRSLTDRGEETLIKPEFEPDDTLADIVRKLSDELERTKPLDNKNSTDKTAKLLGRMPPFLLRFAIGIVRLMDNWGILPAGIRQASPWHTGAFITNVGSLGIGPIYHHLYEFGTCSFFVAMGKKERRQLYDRNGNIFMERTMGLKYVIDERVCDGHYYAVSMRLMRRLMNNPEMLLLPPDKIVMDDGVVNKVNRDSRIYKLNENAAAAGDKVAE